MAPAGFVGAEGQTVLNIVCEPIDAGIRCLVEGELDLAGQQQALDELLPVIDRKPSAVVLDLSRVEFIDSTGLRVLLACRNRAEERGTPLLLHAPAPPVQRLFEVTKIGDRFDYLQDG